MVSKIALAYGPVLIGGCVAFMLSGVVAVQCIIFFKLYPNESRVKTGLVSTVWLLDVAQTAFIIAAFVDYFITHFGDSKELHFIPWPIALTVLVTALQTCLVHYFYAAKIFCSSGRNWFITGPITFFATLRLLAATAATGEMLRIGRWEGFSRGLPHFLFTAGLTLSAGTDAIITLCLCYYLRQIRKMSTSSVMNGVLDTLTLWTLENGFITFLTTVGILAFWLFMPSSSISLALHFVIGKLYPNSLLVLLNTRKSLREMHSGDPGVVIDMGREAETHHNHLAAYYTLFPHRAPKYHHGHEVLTPPPFTYFNGYRPPIKMHKLTTQPPVQVQVHRTVQRTTYTPRKIGRNSDGMSIYSDDSFDGQSFHVEVKSERSEPIATKRKPDPRFIFPASLASSPAASEAGGSLGNTSLHWRALP
ncbi:Glycoside hydrolase [Mycena kentingensis (nom. inval.)]|nr:Glycoside hydrolase [Mycena kentingensis (nom. inval.)]